MNPKLLLLGLSAALFCGDLTHAASRPAAAIVADKVGVDNDLDRLRTQDRALDDELRALQAGEAGSGAAVQVPGGLVEGVELLGIRSGAPAITTRWTGARDKLETARQRLEPGAEKFKQEKARLLAAAEAEHNQIRAALIATVKTIETTNDPEKLASAKAHLASLQAADKAVTDKFDGLIKQNATAWDNYYTQGLAGENAEMDAACREIDRLVAERRLNTVQP